MSQKEHSTPPTEETALEDGSAREPFLRRWSRLKADSAVRPDEPAAPAPVPGGDGQTEGAVAQEDDPEALPPGDEDMPPIESLDENSDFSGFMSPRVSATLRKQALRKLFRSPKFNVISELDDYIDDYRNFPALGDILTADMKHAAARLLEKQLAADSAEIAEASEAGLLARSGESQASPELDGNDASDAAAEDRPTEAAEDRSTEQESSETDDSDSDLPARDV